MARIAKPKPRCVECGRVTVASRASQFHAGVLVTNTGFTPDAQWFAQHNAALLRLRDISDLRRWLHDDFVNESEWREMPESIEVAPGIKILIPRPTLILPRGSSHEPATAA